MMQNEDRLDEKAVEKAERHWAFLEKWFHLIFVDAFIHGYKHGLTEKEGKLGHIRVSLSQKSGSLAEALSDDLEVAEDLASKLHSE